MNNYINKSLVLATLIITSLSYGRMPERIQVPEATTRKATPVDVIPANATESKSTETLNNQGIVDSARQTDEAIIINVKRIIADRSKKSINDIDGNMTLSQLGLDDVDTVLIMTDLQYFFDITFDEKTATELSKNKAKVSAMIDETMDRLYP